MTTTDMYIIVVLASLVWAAFGIGKFFGSHQQQELWRDHMEKSSRYAFAVDDLDKWCGHQSEHARLIARHLKAVGEGMNLNAGTPTLNEACTINGLREQLRCLDAAIARATHKEQT